MAHLRTNLGDTLYTTDMVTKPKLYQCPECDLHYTDKQTATECETWCKEHKSCNLEITKHAVEVKQDSSSVKKSS